MADVMMRFSGNLQKFLTEDEIRQRCPLVFATSPTNSKVSEKYTVANTYTVIQDMEKLGWKVVRAAQRRATKKSSGRFSYHMVALQNPDIKITKQVDGGEEIVECFPQIILTNSHDGLSCFQFRVGLYRCICSNGLVISDAELSEFKIRHIYYSFENLRAVVGRILEALPSKVERMSQMSNVLLSEDQKLDFAKKALSIRKGVKEEELQADEETYKDLLTPVRKEDEGSSLWNVYNVLQEKIVKGGYTTAEEGKKARKVRKVTSFIKELNFSRRIDEIAQSYLVAA